MTSPGQEPAFELPEGMECLPQNTLTRRDYFAAMAMQGLLMNPNPHESVPLLIDSSVKYADALIAELGRETK